MLDNVRRSRLRLDRDLPVEIQEVVDNVSVNFNRMHVFIIGFAEYE